VYFLARDAQGAYERIIVALDAAGHAKLGWGIAAPPGSEFGSLAVGPDGSVYVEERRNLAVGSVLHRLGATARDVPGWPFEVPPDFACPPGQPYNTDDPRTPAVDDPCYPPSVNIGPDGTAYLTNHRPVGPRLIAVEASGKVKPGWPIDLDDQEWSDQRLGSDGSVFLVRRPTGTPTYDKVRGAVDDDAELWAFGPNGKPRSGWPVPVPNISGYLITPQGNLVVRSLINDMGELCSNPRRTVFTVLGPDGRTLPGWPRGSTGHASSPVVGADGTVYYVSATAKVYAHDRAGEVKTGWPVAVPGAGDGCGPGIPHQAPDGTIYVVGNEVVAISPDGRPRSGWPYRPLGELIGPPFDSEGGGSGSGPVFGPDSTVYFVVFRTEVTGVRAEIVALDRQGQVKAGWPVRLPIDPAAGEVASLTVSPDGRLFVRGGDQLFALDPDGTIAN
jgi:outer membrane protein assembly factor BamB